MELPQATRGDYNAPDCLLVIVDCTGIPVLVRPYGDVQIPPSAVVGIVSAVFHAANVGDTSELRALRSTNCSIIYALGEADILVAYVQAQLEEVSACADDMLRLLLRTLEITIGPSLGDLASTKLRVAISRHLAVIDYVVMHIRSDVRLSLRLPVFEAGYGRESTLSMAHPSSLLYAAWVHDGVVHHEIGSWTDGGSRGIDLALISIIAELQLKRKSLSLTVYSHRSLKIVGARADAWRQHQFVLGLFTPEATATDIESFTDLVTRKPSVSAFPHMNGCSTASERLRFLFSGGLQCCFVAPTFSGAMPRVIALRSPAQDAPADTALWAMLSQFTRHCTLTSSTKASPRRMDYKQEDEGFTFLHCVRTPLAIYAVCRGSVSLPDVIKLGDAVASALLLMRV